MHCCIKGNIFKSIFYYGPNFIDKSFEKKYFLILFPFINIFVIVFFIFNLFYLDIITEKYKNNNDGEMYYAELDKKNIYF